MKISEEFRKVAENPVSNRFYGVLTVRAEVFARTRFPIGFHPSVDFTAEEKTLAYLFLAAIAESEGL